jgi:periplasmic protein TonB
MVKTATLPNGMFADSMLQTSWAQRSRRSWTALTSFGLQAVIVGLLLLVPLLQKVGIPMARSISTPVSFGHHVVEPLQPSPYNGDTAHSAPRTAPIFQFGHPAYMPGYRRANREDYSTQPGGDSGPCVGCIETPGSTEGLRNIFSSNTGPVLPVHPAPTKPALPFRTSSMLQGSLIRSVQPVYPPLARTARIQGSVVLSAIIAKDGSIEGLHALSGHPMLVTAAVDAVRQWRYRPYILNNEAIEVETQITVNFTLAGN